MGGPSSFSRVRPRAARGQANRSPYCTRAYRGRIAAAGEHNSLGKRIGVDRDALRNAGRLVCRPAEALLLVAFEQHFQLRDHLGMIPVKVVFLSDVRDYVVELARWVVGSGFPFAVIA